MKVLVITGNPRKEGSLATLTEEAARGASEGGAEVEIIRLADSDIACCRFCLKCFNDTGPDIATCAQKDDMAEILPKIVEADGFILSCPMSSGHQNAYMKILEERCILTLCRPTGRVLWVTGVPESRIADRKRYAVTITTAGVVPNSWRFIFNGPARAMASMAKSIFNAGIVGRLFAGRLVYRRLSKRERRRAYRLGGRLAAAIGAGA